MAFTYNVTTSLGRVRLLCNDNTEASAIFQDAEIDYFLELENSNIRKAAALGLETIAGNEVLVQKRIRLLDLTTDGPAEADALLKRASLLREQADKAENEEDGGFDWAEMPLDDFAIREMIENELLEDV